MAVELRKGQGISLDKGSKKYELRAGWDESISSETMDLDILALMCDENSRFLNNDRAIIFYNNLESFDGSVIHTGDERTGSKEGWDEVLKIDLDKMDSSVKDVVLILNIHEAFVKGQNFGLVKNLKLELFDIENNLVTATFQPDLENSLDTCLVLGEFKIANGKPYFKALGLGHQKGLDVILESYGVDIKK